MEDNKELEVRVVKIEGIVSQMNERLNHLTTDISKLRDKIDSNFRWTIAMWITVILAIILK